MNGPTVAGFAWTTCVRSFAVPLAIGVIADTHLWLNGGRELPTEVVDLFERLDVDLVLHAGDANDVSVLARLGRVAPVIAVAGNNDSRELQEHVQEVERISVGDWSIGLLHGHGGRSARHRAMSTFSHPPDVVVYGHSHIPMIEIEEGVVYFNPGSPTDRRWSPHFGVGMLRVSSQGIDPELILFERPADLGSVGSRSSAKS